jgi:hypothetical protein
MTTARLTTTPSLYHFRIELNPACRRLTSLNKGSLKFVALFKNSASRYSGPLRNN